jgi:hypothetical protein
MNAVLNARKHLSACDMPNRMQSTTLIGYAKFNSRSHDAVIRIHDDAGNMIEAHEHPAISRSRSAIFLAGLSGAFAYCFK